MTMETFASLFDGAGDDVEAEARERIHTMATQAATSTCWPFLALSASLPEFEDRLGLITDRLASIASEHGVSYEEITAPLREGFKAVLEAKEEAGLDPKVSGPHFRSGDICECGAPVEDCDRDHEAEEGLGHQMVVYKDGSSSAVCPTCGSTGCEHLTSQSSVSGLQCADCGHSNPEHAAGGPCPCGCVAFNPRGRRSSLEVQASDDEDPNDRYWCSHCDGAGGTFGLGLPGDTGPMGYQQCPHCEGSGALHRKRRADSDGGYSFKDFDFSPAKWHTSAKTAGPALPLLMHQDKGKDKGSGGSGGLPGLPKIPGVGGAAAEGAGAGEAAELAPLLLAASSDPKGHEFTNPLGYCKHCGMDRPEKGEWSPSCADVREGFGDDDPYPDDYLQASDGSVNNYFVNRQASFDARISAIHQALAEGQDPLTWLEGDGPRPVPTHHDTTQAFEGTNPVALDQAMAEGGGAAQPEVAGGHSEAPVVREAGKEPDPFA